jgi:hypothetical protein
VELHIAVSDASHNIVLIQSLRSIYNLLQHGVFYNRHLLYGYKSGRNDLLAQHRAIHDAVMARGPGCRGSRGACTHGFRRAGVARKRCGGATRADRSQAAERLKAVPAHLHLFAMLVEPAARFGFTRWHGLRDGARDTR